MAISLRTGAVYYLDSDYGRKTDYTDVTKLLDRLVIIVLHVRYIYMITKETLLYYDIHTYVTVIVCIDVFK